MAIVLSDNINYKAPKLADARESYNGERLYSSKQEALDTVDKINRSPGLIAYVEGTQGKIYTYWYRDGIEDVDLVRLSTSDLINDGEDGTNPYITFSDVYKGNILLSFGYYNIINTYDYFVWADKYIFNNITYTEYISDTITLSDGDVLYDRIDVIVLNEDGTFEVVEGTPSANPIKPNIDADIQLEITFIIVTANSTSPNDTVNTLIYDENLQQAGGEANTSKTPTSSPINFDYTQDSYTGTKSTLLPPTETLNIARYALATPFYKTDYTSLVMFVKIANKGSFIKLRVFIDHQVEGYSERQNQGALVQNGTYGLDQNNQTSWQVLVIPISDLGLGNIEYDRVNLRNEGGGSTILADNIFLQKSGNPVPTTVEHNKLEGLQGGDKNRDEFYHLTEEQIDKLTNLTQIEKTSDIPINDGESGLSTYVEDIDLAEVAFTGDYEDLTNKPIPTPSGVQSVTGDGVGGTPENVEMTFPTLQEVIDESDGDSPILQGGGGVDGDVIGRDAAGKLIWTVAGSELTADELAGIQNANGLTAANPVATLNDIPPPTPSGVQSVTGDGVGGTAEDVVMTFPTASQIGALESIDDKSITFQKIQDIPTNTMLGRVASGTGVVKALTKEEARTLLGVTDSSDTTMTGVAAGGSIIAQPIPTNFLNFTNQTTPVILSGLVGGIDGQEVTIWNNSVQALELLNNSPSAVAANRIKTLGEKDISIPVDAKAVLRYTGDEWTMIGVFGAGYEPTLIGTGTRVVTVTQDGKLMDEDIFNMKVWNFNITTNQTNLDMNDSYPDATQGFIVVAPENNREYEMFDENLKLWNYKTITKLT